MVRFAVKLLTLAMFSVSMLTAPIFVQACAAAGDPPSSSPPATDGKPASKVKNKKKTGEIRPGIEDTAFVNGYRAAYAIIYDRNDYAAAIGQLKALGHDDNAAVANLLGYSYRKLGDYKVSQIWYERALKADPNHVKTWQYYGL
ncbi:MAG: tetratricopeptide repeat protein, partial [Bradyrhizobium sp.]|uniref:tetratricopeptide repeat protein n=1 Tax=Bradyrhizobium sp. TaxID=376 RepID=UPI001229F2C9